MESYYKHFAIIAAYFHGVICNTVMQTQNLDVYFILIRQILQVQNVNVIMKSNIIIWVNND